MERGWSDWVGEGGGVRRAGMREGRKGRGKERGVKMSKNVELVK